MKTSTSLCKWSPTNELEQAVEPLASYICASDKPSTALFFVLAALRRQVNSTNELAAVQYRRFLNCQ